MTTENTDSTAEAEVKSTFGIRLKRLRNKELNIGPGGMAKRLGFNSAEPVILFEGDDRLPSAETLIKIAEVFNVDLHELLTGKPTPSLAKEIEALREVKHDMREIRNGIKERMNSLGKLGRKVRECEEIISNTINPKKEKQK